MHIQYWNQNEVPLSIVILPGEIKIYNNFTISKKKILYTSKGKDKSVAHLFSHTNIVDSLGFTSIENIDSELLVKNRISGFLEQGFFIIKENELRNWTLMNAIKDAEYFARLILCEEETNE